LETIEGRAVRVFERRRPIAPTLSLMLEGGRGPDGYLWSPLRVIRRMPLRLGGPRSACLAEDHRMADWLEGFHLASTGQTYQLRLVACQDCGAVCIRDVSVDVLPGLSSGRLPPRRRDHIIGWYSGARPSQRQYT
jgi:hypothetical protein